MALLLPKEVSLGVSPLYFHLINERAIQRPNQMIKAIHLDNYRKPEEQKGIAQPLAKLGKDASASIIILSSPQAIQDSKTYQNMFKHALASSSLKLVVVDEAHLFAQFGLWFRDEFLALKALVFDPLTNDGGRTTRVPVVFMTATATKVLVEQLEKITGLSFDRHLNVFWPNPKDMKSRVQYIGFSLTDAPLNEFKKVLDRTQDKNSNGESRRQWIYFCNSRLELESMHVKVKKYLNEQGYDGDVVFKSRLRNRCIVRCRWHCCSRPRGISFLFALTGFQVGIRMTKVKNLGRVAVELKSQTFEK